MISVSNLCKQYGKFTAVNSISFSVEPGEIFGFLGVNGAGKTTTLRMLAGILAPTSGEISIGGYNLRESPEKARAITGYIPDRPHVYARLTGREFLYFVAELYAVPQAIMEDRIDELLVNFGLLEWQHELIENYSHGMKQRIATCGGLIHSPRVLVVDEPMVGLDPHGAKLFKDTLRLYAEQGVSILLSTHSLHVAEEIADRLAIIHKGQILTTGTFDQIKNQTNAGNINLENLFLQLTSYAPEQVH